MRFAVNVHNFAGFADIRRLAELAKEAEDNGWDGFFLWDHIHFTQQPMIDPWVALAAIAMATSRIRIGTMITPLPRRRPWKLARETISIDQLSGGRLILGVGLGYPPDDEFARLGEDPDDRIRAQKLDEGLDILTGLWSGKPFSYQGEHYQLDNVTFLPRPVQERIPIWIAGIWPAKRPFRRAARYDGVVPIITGPSGEPTLLSPDEIADVVAYVRRHRDADTPFEVSAAASIPVDPAQAGDVVDAFAAAGATWLQEWQPHPNALSERLRAGVPRT
ncbi:MAG: TIGR03619 family F420-dependent LLM class oxidoreductase [Chloroflexi bacterium]|nr:TIGR03619 family F420-dependent LLM class oxidoreductase [Chloroflexota bacterium]